ncbi:hypothetical protein [Aggregatibacter actinomycetemcomitans]|uniref:hypothetical protein n=1 Tax=Aggregatibacter actinomycetemcomitans TaxID=714 RepID=UPI001F121F5D|nr:hypothetical protein [Aggregatibacter actinomycetemcomitans]
MPNEAVSDYKNPQYTPQYQAVQQLWSPSFSDKVSPSLNCGKTAPLPHYQYLSPPGFDFVLYQNPPDIV